MLDITPFNPTDLFVEGVSIKRLRKHVGATSHCGFLEPLITLPLPATSQDHEGDFMPVKDKQYAKMKNRNSISCTLPKTLKKLQEKNSKGKSNFKKSAKTIDFPRIVEGPEATCVSDKRKAKAMKESGHQNGRQASTNSPASHHALDWALLQPSIEPGTFIT